MASRVYLEIILPFLLDGQGRAWASGPGLQMDPLLPPTSLVQVVNILIKHLAPFDVCSGIKFQLL